MERVKAIETQYNGYRFRSRLEARWAVFFDSYGIDYEYELEGFELGNGLRYLPDFYIPSLSVFVEIKPNQQLSMTELRKIDAFAVGGDKHLVLVMGSPTNEEMVLINRCSMAPLCEYCDENEYELADEEIVAEYIANAVEFSHVEFNRSPLNNLITLCYRHRCPPDEVSFKKSLLKAKQSRFEYGESG